MSAVPHHLLASPADSFATPRSPGALCLLSAENLCFVTPPAKSVASCAMPWTSVLLTYKVCVWRLCLSRAVSLYGVCAKYSWHTVHDRWLPAPLSTEAAVHSRSCRHGDRLGPQLFTAGVRQSSRLAAVSPSPSHHLDAAGHCEWLKQQTATDCSPFPISFAVLLQMPVTDLCAPCCPSRAPQCMMSRMQRGQPLCHVYPPHSYVQSKFRHELPICRSTDLHPVPGSCRISSCHWQTLTARHQGWASAAPRQQVPSQQKVWAAD